MDLDLIPVRLRLYGLVTLEVTVFGVGFTKTLFKKKIWEYEAPKITKRMIEVSTRDEDASPPEFGPPVQAQVCPLSCCLIGHRKFMVKESSFLCTNGWK